MRAVWLLGLAAALMFSDGCGVIRDMRSEYVAYRAVRNAQEALGKAGARRDVVRSDLDLAYRLRSHDPRFVARLAVLYQATGDFAKALACYETSANWSGKAHDLQIGYCLLQLGDKKQGIQRLTKALAEAQEAYTQGRLTRARYANILNDVGYGLVDTGVQVDKAFELVAEAVRLEPLNAAYIDSLGWAYYRRQQYLEAAFYLERAARLGLGQEPEILWHLGAVHAQLGRYRRAESERRQALRLDPANNEARQLLRKLQRELPPPAR
ncbi:MAG: hypothetical protein ACUVX8_06850, partial [Candidatus Zipacnadales bacterium]